MKTCFLITAYCNTDKKVLAMNNCVDNLKNMGVGDVCIYSHYPVDSDIQNKVSQCIYDYSNPILGYPDKYIAFWKLIGKIKLNIPRDDYGYTVFQQWIRGYGFVSQLGYDNVIIINYDVIITKNLVDSILLKLKRSDGVIFYFGESYINMTLIALNINSNIPTFFNYINIEEYKKCGKVAESYIYEKITNSGLNLIHINHDEYSSEFYTTMDMIGDIEFKLPNAQVMNNPFDKFILKSSRYFIGNMSDDDLYLFIFDITEPLDIEIKIKNVEFHKFLYYSEATLLYKIPITNSEFISDKYEIELTVGDETVKYETIKLFKNCSLYYI